MSEQKGIDGVVKVADAGGTLVALLNVTSFSIEETTETIDVTSMGDGNRVVLPTFTGFSGSIDGYWDASSTLETEDGIADPVIVSGDIIDFEIYPGGTSSGKLYYAGSAILTSVSRSSSYDGAVEYSLSFEGTGGLTYGKVA